ncbi:uncharacterized protein BO95DRAFT_432234 [Aspergillus brunneoviolaceus CBS 621.78]|uniref:Uncharacterized protein n=1 Tax=Aspergillus brunneoviolaceus CBS 621.78 TaxID=1450534 RepID=A0ACD1G7W5_9EURO|nr:hypothetical protein BO95DRAFT_432234 [Aspergillus brunneoviolaceus CBS 621.78]RAH45262.1 hypothetical protein BO95DRAFT_432234 [Aspergillus brunneoviolaceus CBS 621.78]
MTSTPTPSLFHTQSTPTTKIAKMQETYTFELSTITPTQQVVIVAPETRELAAQTFDWEILEHRLRAVFQKLREMQPQAPLFHGIIHAFEHVRCYRELSLGETGTGQAVYRYEFDGEPSLDCVLDIEFLYGWLVRLPRGCPLRLDDFPCATMAAQALEVRFGGTSSVV